MANDTPGLRGLTFLIADANSFFSSICQTILRGFGAAKIVEVRDAAQAARALGGQRIDLILCDLKLPPDSGLGFTTAVRASIRSDYRATPILIMATDTRTSTVHRARDCGANMMIAKPLSPARLFDRLSWMALAPRPLIDTPTYFGPDRRFKTEGIPNGIGRRKGDNIVEIVDAVTPRAKSASHR